MRRTLGPASDGLGARRGTAWRHVAAAPGPYYIHAPLLWSIAHASSAVRPGQVERPCQAMSVSTQPGQTAFTWIRRGASSAASERTSPSSPAFDAQYAVYPGTPMRARIDDVTTMRPPSESSCSAARQHQ